jgi:hypothetical protein
MMRPGGWSFEVIAAVGLFMIIGLLAPSGCADLPSDAVTSSSGGVDEVGSVRLALTAGTTVGISSATYTLTGPGSYSKTGMLNAASSSGVLSGLIGGIPAGTAYQIMLQGTSTDGSETCSGSATFDIMVHATTPVEVPLICREVLSAGSASVSDTTNICPVVDGVAASPMAAPSGGTIALTATAHDKDNGPSPLSYQWTVTAGTLSDAANPSPTFTCPATMTSTMITITVLVSDGDCSDSMPLTVTCG